MIENTCVNLILNVMIDVFLGYSINSKAYRIYNIRTQTIMESVNVAVDDTNDLYEFSKEELISSLIDDADEDQTVAIFFFCFVLLLTMLRM